MRITPFTYPGRCFALYVVTAFMLCVIFHTHALAAPDGNSQKRDKQAPGPYSRYHALVVGISQYDVWPQAPHAVEQARSVAHLLTQLGFSVTLLVDSTSRELKEGLESCVTMNDGDDSGLLFYFAGNGDTRYTSGQAGLGYIIPKDCPQADMKPEEFNALAMSMSDMERWCNKLAFGHVLLLLDTTLAGDRFTIHDPVVLKSMTNTDSECSRQFIIAGNADEPLTGEGWFKHFLIKGLKGEADFIHDGYVTGSELAYFIKNRVNITSSGRLHSQYGVMGDPLVSIGDFMFKPFTEDTSQSRLFVTTRPPDAQVRILNIKPKFENGMVLDPGKYHLSVAAKGFLTDDKWITLKTGESKEVEVSLSESEFTNSLGMTFVYMSPGRFSMGSRDGDDESPHQVRITRGFFLQATEVTVNQFNRFARSAHYKTQAEQGKGCWVQLPGSRWKLQKESNWKNPGMWESPSSPQAPDHPVTCVTWNDANAFVRWLSNTDGKTYDLPTEAEWEYACRAGTGTRFAFGRCLSTDQANFGDPESERSGCRGMFKHNREKPVSTGSLGSNAWGLFDMHGNVSEWCRDWYGPYPETSVTNPKGASDDLNKRVFRGGSWLSDADGCRSAKRYKLNPDWANYTVGFRVVMRP